jgi:hypothetical protein
MPSAANVSLVEVATGEPLCNLPGLNFLPVPSRFAIGITPAGGNLYTASPAPSRPLPTEEHAAINESPFETRRRASTNTHYRRGVKINEKGPRRALLRRRILSRTAIRGVRPSFSRLIVTWTMAGWLIAATVFAAGATTATAGQTASGQDLGSADDYVQSNPADAYESTLLGIAVQNGTGELGHGLSVSGVEVLNVIPGSPGGAAGLQDCQPRVFRTTATIIGMLAAGALFPPAISGVMALSNIGQSHETIIAVDGERTPDIAEFEGAIEKAGPGEVVYLTVVSGGQREQIRVALPVQ